MINQNNIETTTEYLNRTSKDYAIYVAQNRSIPSVCDGLKHGQRIFLWLMRKSTDKIKTVSLSGLGIQQNLFLHGDSSASESISALAAPYINNVTFFDGIGTFGTRVSPTAWGAPRYTYVKKSKAAQEILFNDLDIVPVKDNYDGSNKEPEHFLPLIPTVLLNGISGIAVGWSTEILPHKLDDLINACLQVLNNKKVSELTPFYQKLNVDIKKLEENSWEITGKVDIIDSSTIRILELPQDLSLEKFKERLNDYEDNNKIKDYIDRSSENINILVNFKRGEIKGWDQQKAIEFFKLKTRKTQRIIVIDWNGKAIKKYDSSIDLVKDFVSWRLTWYRKRYETLLKQTVNDLEYNYALQLCFENKLPQTILKLSNKKEVITEIESITKDFEFQDEIKEKIASIPSYRWTKDVYEEIKQKIEDLKTLIDSYEHILSNEQEIKNIYKKELLNLRSMKF